jgi:hypothetical protein
MGPMRCCCPCWPFVGPRIDPTVRVRDDRSFSSKRRAGTLLYGAVLDLYCTGTVPPYHLVTTLPRTTLRTAISI